MSAGFALQREFESFGCCCFSLFDLLEGPSDLLGLRWMDSRALRRLNVT